MMKLLTAIALVLLTSAQTKPAGGTVPAALNFTMKSIDGKAVDLSKYLGRVVLMVNVASECGFTPQYAGLEELNILGFPSNNFGGQEPGSDPQIAEFCEKNYGVKFDMFSKIVVLGKDQAPLYHYLTTHPKFPGQVEWNFEKFLIGRNGEVIGRFKSEIEPLSKQMTSAIESALTAK
jgi:glutathione peroxidase